MAREHEIDEQQRQPEHDGHLIADELLLIGHRAPFEAHAGRQRAARDLLHELDHLTGRESLRRQANDGRGWIEVVEADQRGAHRRRDLHQGAERDHVAVLVAHRQIVDVLEAQPEARIALHVNLEHAPELVELIDVARAEVAAEGGKHLIDGDAEPFRLHPIDLGRELRHVGAERREHQLQRGLALGIGHDRVGDILQFRHVEAAVAQLHLHGEAGIVADALDRRRRHHQDVGLLDLAERVVELLEQREQVLALAALAPVFEDDVGNAGAGQRGAVVERRHPGNVDDLGNAWHRPHDLVDLVQGLLCAFERRAFGQLHERDHVALILDRQEPGRHAREAVAGDGDHHERRDRHQGAALDHARDHGRVPAFGRVITAIECAVENVALLRRDRRSQPHRALRRFQCDGVDGAEQRSRRDHERELRVHAPGQPGQERGREEHRHQHQGDADDRPEQLAHGAARRLASGHALLDVVDGAFDHDDRVVDDDADRQHDREQSGEVDREAERRHGSKGADDGDRHGGGRHQHGAPILQEHQNDD